MLTTWPMSHHSRKFFLCISSYCDTVCGKRLKENCIICLDNCILYELCSCATVLHCNNIFWVKCNAAHITFFFKENVRLRIGYSSLSMLEVRQLKPFGLRIISVCYSLGFIYEIVAIIIQHLSKCIYRACCWCLVWSPSCCVNLTHQTSFWCVEWATESKVLQLKLLGVLFIRLL